MWCLDLDGDLEAERSASAALERPILGTNSCGMVDDEGKAGVDTRLMFSFSSSQ